MTPSLLPIDDRIRAAIGRALRVDGGTLTAPAMFTTPGWDSMGHMTIVLELESEFGVSFPLYLLPDLVDIPAIANALRDVAGSRSS